MTGGGSGRPAAESPTGILSRYISEAPYDRIPDAVVEKAKLHLLDSLACMIGGTRLTPSRLVLQLFTELGGPGEAIVVGTGTRLPAPHAAYVNAYFNNALDFDDSAVGHPASTTMPPALAVAERVGASGRKLLTAIVLGYEVSIRVGQAIRPTRARYKQVCGLATWQIFGAVAAVASLLELDLERTRHAFGLAGLNAPVPCIRKFGHAETERPYGWAKNNYGWASMGAVLAGLMAQRGFMGNRAILDGEQGFWVMAGSDRCDFGAMTAGLGEEYLMARAGFKSYACCRLAHTTLDAVRAIRARARIDPAGIARVEVATFSELVENLGGPRPTSIIDAQFHLPYLVALELTGRSPAQGLAEDDLGDSAVLALTEKVTMQLDPDADRRFFEHGLSPSRVVITLRDGNRLEAAVEAPAGSPDGAPVTPENVRAKFHALAAPVLGAERARALEAVVLALDRHSTADLVRAAVRA